MIPLSEATQDRLQLLFTPSDQPLIRAILEEECGDNLPMVDPTSALLAERIRFAVLKLSNGSFEDLKRATDEAKLDWRDTLDMAGFYSSDSAHLAWVVG